MIRVENVTKIFGSRESSILPLVEEGKTKDEIQAETGHVLGVNRASFELAEGQVFAIMGLSGSGKSTMIRCVNRLIEPTSGKIYLKDSENGEKDLTEMPIEELRQLRAYQMSMVFQHFALFPHRSVLGNTIYGLEIQGRDKSESEKIGQRMLKMVGLGGWEEAYPDELSGGMQQRVGLARALATEAKILLMDEPFSALDPLIRVQMQQELMNIQSELARTILFITHDLDEAMYIGDRIAIMDAGEIVQIGTPEEILVNPRTEYVARFVEHADPTHVITAATVMLPVDSGWFERVRSDDAGSWIIRRGNPETEYHLDADNKLQAVSVSGERVSIKPLQQTIKQNSEGVQQRRRNDVVFHCTRDTVLRDLLRGRKYSTLPVVVLDNGGVVCGIVDETELITGILEKRGESMR